MLSQVQELLKSKYHVDHYFDLHEFDQQHHSVLLSALANIKQEEFADNYRIVFYYFQPLKRTYDDDPYDIIEKLQEMLVYYDIPNFFVLVATNDDTVSNDLDHVYKKYTRNEQDPIRYINV